jgi:hypothetical protein
LPAAATSNIRRSSMILVSTSLGLIQRAAKCSLRK